MRHAELLALTGGSLNDSNTLRDSVLTLGHDLNDSTSALGRSHDNMFGEEIVLEHVSELVTTSNHRAWGLFEVRDESVFAVLIKGGEIDTTGHEYGTRDLGNGLKRSLDTIENSLENTYTQEL